MGDERKYSKGGDRSWSRGEGERHSWGGGGGGGYRNGGYHHHSKDGHNHNKGHHHRYLSHIIPVILKESFQTFVLTHNFSGIIMVEEIEETITEVATTIGTELHEEVKIVNVEVEKREYDRFNLNPLLNI